MSKQVDDNFIYNILKIKNLFKKMARRNPSRKCNDNKRLDPRK